jgi:osmotically-inducible protein OsmY
MVGLLTPARIEDLQIEQLVRLALDRHAQVPFESIAVSVRDGVATLTGHVDWPYQAASAVAATRTVPGVRHVIGLLTVAAA